MNVGSIYATFELNAKGFTSGLKDVEKKTESTANKVQQASKSFLTFKTALVAAGAAAVYTGLKLANMASDVESVLRRIDAVSGSAEKGANAFKFLEAESKRLGISLDVATKAFSGMAAAARETVLEGQELYDIFSAVAESATIMGLSSQRTELAFLAIEQMIGKGVVSMEELRRQLSEQLPGAMQTLARALGVTQKELNKLVSTGSLLAEDILPLLAKQMREDNAEAVAKLGTSLHAALGRLGTAWFNLKKIMTDGAVNSALSSFVSIITVALDNVTLLARGINSLVTSLGNLKNLSSGGGALFDLSGIDKNLSSGGGALFDDLDSGIEKLKDFTSARVKALQTAEDVEKRARMIGEKTTSTIAAFQEKFAGIISETQISAASVGADSFEEARQRLRVSLEGQRETIQKYLDAQLSQLRNFEEARVAVTNEANLLFEQIEATHFNRLAEINKEANEVLLEEMEKNFQERWGALYSVSESILGDFKSFFVDWATGVDVSFKDMVNSMIVKLLEFTTEILLIQPILEMLKNSLKSVGDIGGGGFLSGLLGALAGPVTGMAKGGVITEPVAGVGASGNKYLFGENGPEAVLPTEQLDSLSSSGGGGGGNTVVVNINAVDSKSLTELMRRNPQAVTAPIVEALSNGDRGLTTSLRLAVT